jgi:hypothetical protein
MAFGVSAGNTELCRVQPSRKLDYVVVILVGAFFLSHVSPFRDYYNIITFYGVVKRFSKIRRR